MAINFKKLGAGIAFTGLCVDMTAEFWEVSNPLTDHIGNWMYIVCYGGLLPALVGRALIHRGWAAFGRWLPRTTTLAACIYMILGESLLPEILPGVADPWDIPSVVLAGISTYLGVDYVTQFKRGQRQPADTMLATAENSPFDGRESQDRSADPHAPT